MSTAAAPWSAQEEAALVAQARDGDATAVRHLYHHYATGIYTYLASRLRDSAAIEDLTTEVFERALQGLPYDEQRGVSLAAWLYRIAHDRAANHLRLQRERPTLRLDERLRANAGDLVASPDPRLAGDPLRQAIAQLTQEQQQVMALRFYADLKLAEIAYVLDKNIEAIEVLEWRALNRLQELVGQPS